MQNGPEEGHVLFMDLVGCAKLSTPAQLELIAKLTDIVSRTKTFQSGRMKNELISLPTGDGIALVFFRNPLSPVQCALEITSALKAHSDINLRMGLNSGPVIRVEDINQKMNITGGGINFAQRVMDLADGGHILVSVTVANNLRQFGEWDQWLEDLGEHSVKHGALVHVFRLSKDGLGSTSWPSKLGKAGSIPIELRDECLRFIFSFEELANPMRLRAFTSIKGLELVNRSIPNSSDLDQIEFFTRLLLTRKRGSPATPILFDLLDALAIQHRDNAQADRCHELKEKLRKVLSDS